MNDSKSDDVTRTAEPTDRLTGLCAEMTTVLDRPENSDVKAIVMLDDGEMGGIQMHGYEDDIAGVAHLFVHIRAILRANGKDLDLVGIPDSLEGLT